MDEEYWFHLCKQAVSTTDPDEFAWMIRNINRMLYEKQLHLKEQGHDDTRSGVNARVQRPEAPEI